MSTSRTVYVLLDGDEILGVVLYNGPELTRAQGRELAQQRGAHDQPRALLVEATEAPSFRHLGISDPGCDDCGAVRVDDCLCGPFEAESCAACGSRDFHPTETCAIYRTRSA